VIDKARATVVTTVALFLLSAVSLLSGCNAVSLLQSREERAQSVAQENGWTKQQFATGQYTITGFRPRYSRGSDALAVYIEGDGVAWVTPTVISSDPTPDTPLTLSLAVQDPTPNRIYLARPCQYAPQRELAQCDPAFWTSHRYAPEILASLNKAIDQAKQESGAQHIRVFGYSGGGNLAILIASQRTDVTAIVTIAGNIDHGAWTRAHGDTPLFGSLDAVDVADSVAHIPQTHFVGEEDDVVPPHVSASYAGHAGDTSRLSIINVSGADHDCCWVEKWPSLLKAYVYRRH